MMNNANSNRPFFLLRPRVFPDGNMWCVLYGDNIQEGVCAFGETPAKAAELFDEEWRNGRCGPRGNALVQDGDPEAAIKKRKRVGWWFLPIPQDSPEGEPITGFFISDERAATFSTEPGFVRHTKIPCWIET